MRRRLLNLLTVLSLLLCVTVAALWVRSQAGSGDRLRERNAGDASPWSASAIATTKHRGDVVAEALARFHDREDRFPTTLAELVPHYLGDVPSPGSGKWEYTPSSSLAGYVLSVTGDRDSDPELYRTAVDGWVFDDK